MHLRMDKYQDYVHIYTHWCMHGFMLQVVGNMQIRAFGHADTKSSKATDIDKALPVKTMKEWAARSFMNWYLSKSHRWINGKSEQKQAWQLERESCKLEMLECGLRCVRWALHVASYNCSWTKLIWCLRNVQASHSTFVEAPIILTCIVEARS